MGFEHEKLDVDRIVAMLTKLGQRGYAVNEESAQYSVDLIDPDSDTDTDPDESKENTYTKSVNRTKICV